MLYFFYKNIIEINFVRFILDTLKFITMIKNINPAKFLSPVLVLTSIILFTNCKKDAKSSSELISTSSIKTKKVAYSYTIGTNAFYLEDALPAGYVKDGSADYTSYIQSVLSRYSEVVFPGFPLLINSQGLSVPSNRRIHFLDGSVLKLKPTTSNYYNIIKIERASYVTLINPVIIGDNATHSTAGGRAGRGISLFSASNVTINNPKVSNCYGDGIYVGRSSGDLPYCKTVKLKNAFCKNNSRNGISIICVDGLQVLKAYCGYSGLTGFDIEGNYGDEQQKNMSISDVTTERNAFNGFTIALSRTYAPYDKTIGLIEVINHKDISSQNYSFKCTLGDPADGMGTVTGTVNVVNPVWIKPGSGRPNYNRVASGGFKTYISNPSVQNLSGTWLSDAAIVDLLDLNIKYDTFVQLIF